MLAKWYIKNCNESVITNLSAFSSTGRVLTCKDGVVTVAGLWGVGAGEVVMIGRNSIMGLVSSLEPQSFNVKSTCGLRFLHSSRVRFTPIDDILSATSGASSTQPVGSMSSSSSTSSSSAVISQSQRPVISYAQCRAISREGIRMPNDFQSSIEFMAHRNSWDQLDRNQVNVNTTTVPSQPRPQWQVWRNNEELRAVARRVGYTGIMPQSGRNTTASRSSGLSWTETRDVIDNGGSIIAGYEGGKPGFLAGLDRYAVDYPTGYRHSGWEAFSSKYPNASSHGTRILQSAMKLKYGFGGSWYAATASVMLWKWPIMGSIDSVAWSVQKVSSFTNPTRKD